IDSAIISAISSAIDSVPGCALATKAAACTATVAGRAVCKAHMASTVWPPFAQIRRLLAYLGGGGMCSASPLISYEREQFANQAGTGLKKANEVRVRLQTWHTASACDCSHRRRGMALPPIVLSSRLAGGYRPDCGSQAPGSKRRRRFQSSS